MLWLMVALGGALGAMARFGISQYWPMGGDGAFPWATAIANVIGALCIGLCYGLLLEKVMVADYWRPLLMVGFLGAFTTFSTFSIESLLLWQQGFWQQAVVYMISSVIACLLATA